MIESRMGGHVMKQESVERACDPSYSLSRDGEKPRKSLGVEHRKDGVRNFCSLGMRPGDPQQRLSLGFSRR